MIIFAEQTVCPNEGYFIRNLIIIIINLPVIIKVIKIKLKLYRVFL